LTGDPDEDLPIPGAHVRPNHRTEGHNFGTAEFTHEIENVVTVAAAPDAVLVLDRDRASAAFVQRAGNEDIVREYVATDPVAHFRRIRSGLVGRVKGHDFSFPNRAGQIVGERGDATAAGSKGRDESGSRNGATPLPAPPRVSRELFDSELP
jgi:hypothetical protein